MAGRPLSYEELVYLGGDTHSCREWFVDMVGRPLFYEELVNRVKSCLAHKRQKTGESSPACPPPSVPPTRQSRSRETSLPTSASASIDPPALVVDPPPRAPSSSVSNVRVGWPAEIPPTVSLLGDMPLEAVARRLISPRDSKVLKEGSGLEEGSSRTDLCGPPHPHI
nr:uncharacterized protein LOC109181117 [Ipomoea trifida]